MSNEERLVLKREKDNLKRVFESLKREVKRTPSDKRDTLEFYEMLQELSDLRYRIDQIRTAIFDSKFRRFYLSTILENFVFGEEDNQILGGR
ncbi:MAG: hypothetical protein NC483_05570 [Ruminococcus sp.]|nr:hypothetical protein [Ruminococcus sp.]